MLSIFFIGLALSMDAFSLSVGLGTTNIEKGQKLLLAISIGVMHFIMSQIGRMIGDQVNDFLFININIINIIIFLYLAILMFIKKDKPPNILFFTFINIVVLSICVSIDSLTVGFAMDLITKHHIFASLVFGLFSGFISYTGLFIGEGVANVFKDKSKIMGGLLMLMIAIVNLIKELN